MNSPGCWPQPIQKQQIPFYGLCTYPRTFPASPFVYSYSFKTTYIFLSTLIVQKCSISFRMAYMIFFSGCSECVSHDPVLLLTRIWPITFFISEKNSIPQGFCLTSASVISNIIKSRGFWRRTPGAYKWAGNAVLCKAVPWSRLYWTATVCQALSWEIQGSVLGIDRAWQEDQLQWVWPPGLHGIRKHRNKKGKTCISETR